MRIARQNAPISRSVTAPSSTCPNRSAACPRASERAPSLPRPISRMYWLMPMSARFSQSTDDFRLYAQLRLVGANHAFELGNARTAIRAALQLRLQLREPPALIAPDAGE